MDAFTGVILYFLIWWVSIFMVLNIGHKTENHPQVGNAQSAPVKFYLGKKILLNSIIAAVIWLCVWCAVKYSGISFRQMVENWQ
jgi:predicted secreted protein